MRSINSASALRVLTTALLLAAPLPLRTVPAAHAAQRSASAPVFDEEFRSADWGRRGAVWSDHTTAYPDGSSNPAGYKLDRVQASSMSATNGLLHFTATARSARGPWQTGLVTTEPWHSQVDGGRGFQLRTGDYARIRLRLPGSRDGGGHGAWPGIWTWRGGNEVDVLEWHSEVPDTAEFANHTRNPAPHRFVRSALLGFGRWITVGIRFGATDVSWYLGDDTHALTSAYDDRTGVGTQWHAYLIANLSISDQPGRTPTSTQPVTMDIDSIVVYR